MLRLFEVKHFEVKEFGEAGRCKNCRKLVNHKEYKWPQGERSEVCWPCHKESLRWAGIARLFYGRQDDGIYIIKEETDKFVKIGIAKDLHLRLSDLQTASHSMLSALVYIDSGGRTLERQLHTLFYKSHKHREWFYFRPEIQAFVSKCQRIAEMDREAHPKLVDNLLGGIA